MNRAVVSAALALATLSSSALATSAAPPGSDPVPMVSSAAARDHLVHKRHLEEDAHLGRLAIWGLSSVVVGGALIAANAPGVLPAGVDARPVLGFGIQSAAWGAIDLAIVGLSFLGDRFPPATTAQALAEENTLGDVLWLNVGLDAGYMMAGGSLVGVGVAGVVDDPVVAVDLASHGAGVVVQGGALLVLDAIALASHGDRLTGLWSLPPELPPAPTDTPTIQAPTTTIDAPTPSPTPSPTSVPEAGGPP
jgi:hypothetical protein